MPRRAGNVPLSAPVLISRDVPEKLPMLRQFFEYYRPWKRLFWLDFGCAVMSGVLELAFPLAVTVFIDRLLPRATGR